jgi:hypothetical protein
MELSVDERKAMLTARLTQLARNYYDTSIDLEVAKASNDADQIARVQSRLTQIDASYNVVQTMLDQLTVQPAPTPVG